MEELPYVIIMSIVLVSSWVESRKKIVKAENIEDIRRALVPLLLMVILFIASISAFFT